MAGCAAWLVLACCLGVLVAGQQEEPLIGWRGESYKPEEVFDEGVGTGSEGLKGASHVRPPNPSLEGIDQIPLRGEVLSWEPRVFYYPNLLTKEECLHLRRIAIPQMKRSVVYDAEGKLVVDGIRTSYGTFLPRLKDETVKNVSERVAKLTHVPAVYQENLQILRYGKAQYYNAHYDSHEDRFTTPRLITVLLYLSEVEEGGETTFPLTNWTSAEWEARNGPFSECASGHVSVKPHMGDAAVFYSFRPDGKMDELSKHSGCPVLKGTKWTATSWVHTAPYQPEYFHVPTPEEAPVDPGFCNDVHPNCEKWANEGECHKNAEYMIGNGDIVGACRKSCSVCRECLPEDRGCYMKNRAQAGFLTLDADEEEQDTNSVS